MISEDVSQPQGHAPLPPLLSKHGGERKPPPALVSSVGPLLATFIHNYQVAGPIYRYYDSYARKETIALAGIEANQFVTSHGRSHFGARDFRRRQLNELGSDKYLVGMDGEDHHSYRKLQARSFSRSTLDKRYPELVEIVSRRALAWQPGQDLVVNSVFQEIVTEQLGATMLNYPSPDSWKTICNYVAAMLAASFSSQPMDEQRLATYQQMRQAVMSLMDDVLAAHRAQPFGEHRPDLIDDLLSAVNKDGNPVTEQDLRIGALSIYIAGIEPVVYTCTFMLYALLQHPHILERVVAEVDDVLSREPLSSATLRDMKCLRYATMETLRMYPFAPVLQMSALESFDFGGYHVEAGTLIVAGQAVAHFLPEIYANPYTFDIDRYQPDRAEHRRPGTFAPYGVGHHTCLGAGFSEVQIMITMATLLATVELALDPETVRPIPATRYQDTFKVRLVRQRQ